MIQTTKLFLFALALTSVASVKKGVKTAKLTNRLNRSSDLKKSSANNEEGLFHSETFEIIKHGFKGKHTKSITFEFYADGETIHCSFYDAEKAEQIGTAKFTGIRKHVNGMDEVLEFDGTNKTVQILHPETRHEYQFNKMNELLSKCRRANNKSIKIGKVVDMKYKLMSINYKNVPSLSATEELEAKTISAFLEQTDKRGNSQGPSKYFEFTRNGNKVYCSSWSSKNEAGDKGIQLLRNVEVKHIKKYCAILASYKLPTMEVRGHKNKRVRFRQNAAFTKVIRELAKWEKLIKQNSPSNKFTVKDYTPASEQ